MVLANEFEYIAIWFYRIWTEYRHINIGQQFIVIRHQCRIANHQRNLINWAMIIALEVAAISSCAWIRTDIYRTWSALSSWHAYYNHIFPFNLVKNSHWVSQYVTTDFLPVVHHVPEILHQLMHVIKTLDVKRTILSVFFYTKHNYTALAICKSGIRLPQRVGQTATGRFDLKQGILFICCQQFKAERWRRIHVYCTFIMQIYEIFLTYRLRKSGTYKSVGLFDSKLR